MIILCRFGEQDSQKEFRSLTRDVTHESRIVVGHSIINTTALRPCLQRIRRIERRERLATREERHSMDIASLDGPDDLVANIDPELAW